MQIGMMPLRKSPVGRTDLRSGTATVEPEYGVMMKVSVFQCLTLARATRTASINTRISVSHASLYMIVLRRLSSQIDDARVHEG